MSQLRKMAIRMVFESDAAGVNLTVVRLLSDTCCRKIVAHDFS